MNTEQLLVVNYKDYDIWTQREIHNCCQTERRTNAKRRWLENRAIHILVINMGTEHSALTHASRARSSSSSSTTSTSSTQSHTFSPVYYSSSSNFSTPHIHSQVHTFSRSQTSLSPSSHPHKQTPTPRPSPLQFEVKGREEPFGRGEERDPRSPRPRWDVGLRFGYEEIGMEGEGKERGLFGRRFRRS